MRNRFSDFDRQMMRRALQLAANGLGFTSPNPMVGAVIAAPDGRVIGEGWHRRYGEAHAEVNAVASVSEADRALLKGSTIYVTLEPCSHYGKTPPCALLLRDTGFKRVVAATADPNKKVAGKGFRILKEAGIKVECGLLEEESRELNKRFIKAHTMRFPFITLKWAESADEFMDHLRGEGEGAYRFSNAMTGAATMRLRSMHDAILTTASTVNADNSRLTVRGWNGRQPRRIVLDPHNILRPDAAMLHDGCGEVMVVREHVDMEMFMRSLFEDEGITSVLVEAGPGLLYQMLLHGMWDEARVEVSPVHLGSRGTASAPRLAQYMLIGEEKVGDNTLCWYKRM